MMFGVVRYCVLLTLLLIAPGRAAPVTLKLTMQAPLTDPFQGKSIGDFKAAVERETGNAVSIEVFDKGQLHSDDHALEAVMSGAVEMGIVGLNQVGRLVPSASIMEQPFLFNFEALVRAATSADSEMRRLIDDAIRQSAGVRVLWWQTVGPQIFYTKAGDVRTPDNLSSLKTRVDSDTMARFVQHCGGAPIALSGPKMVDALEDGTLDVGMVSIAAAKTLDLWRVTRAITRTDHASVEFLILINAQSWAKLTEEQRRIFVAEARTVERRARERAALLEAAGYDFARSKGMQIHELTRSEVAQWRTCSADVFSDYLERGGELTDQLMKAYAKLRLHPCCNAGPARDGFSGQ
jgi:TRAP-type C4-dicarboxylate transport system substrate-binding protein